MKKRLVVIKTDGTVEELDQKKAPDLKQLQSIVGGYIELVPGLKYEGDEAYMYVNEEGKLKGLPINYKATELFQKIFGPFDVVCGNVAVLVGWES